MSGSRHTVLTLAGMLVLAPPVHAGNQLLQVPIRWCAIKGSPAADNPAGVGEPDTDNALWRRHERASDRVWLAQGTNLTFRSPFTNDRLPNPTLNFPVINDPSASPGMPGDILDPNLGNKTEYEAAKQACKVAWDAQASQASLLGPIALNVRKLVRTDGTESLQGYGEFAFTAASATANCANPPTGLQSAAGALAIADYFFLRAFDADETILAHEFGHALGLEHGNGLDDAPANGRFDGFNTAFYQGGCDAAENEAATPASLMTPSVNAKVITALQKGKARAFGVIYSGAATDPPAALIPGDTLGDALVDTIYDVTDRSLDITDVTVSNHRPSETTIFSHALIDQIPSNVDNQYLVFADLDANAATGGAPADLALGVPTTFAGAELVTRVIVFDSDGRAVVPTVWKFDGATFVEVTDPSIEASVDTMLGGEVTQPQLEVVSIQMSQTVRGPAADTIRIQAFAQTLPPPPPPSGPALATVTDPLPFDVVPDATTPGGGALGFFEPQYPVCSVTPAQARPGQAVTVEATNLLGGRMAKVLLGDLMLGGGTTTAAGNLTLSIAVPADAALGERLVTVGIVGTALTADCTVEVAGAPIPVTAVAIDVQPGSCPNAFNPTKKGTLPVAILGSATLDVRQIDVSLIRLEGVPPLRSTVADVATPFVPITGRTRATDCTTLGPDGFPDLVLHFDVAALRPKLGLLVNGSVRVLQLSGNLKPASGGVPIAGEDVILIRLK